MTAQKLFIAALILIVVLFAGSTVLGTMRGGDKPAGQGDLSPAWISGLRARLAPEKNLEPSYVAAASPERCWPKPDTFVIAPGAPCTVELHGSAFLSLKLVLQVVQGQGLAVAVTQEVDQGRRVMTTQTLKPLPVGPTPTPGPTPRGDQTQGPDILKAGATMVLTCSGVTPCQARLIFPSGGTP
jgi:hypothetical protein